MKCILCSDVAVFANPAYCKRHFTDYVEEKVFDTIERFGLIQPEDKILVAASGGKDSLTLLHLLSKKFKVDCLAIDEGIEGYREKTLSDLKRFCADRKINLVIVSYLEEFGGRLGNFLAGQGTPCSVCGPFRRYLLNKYAKDYDKLCTGHNLDDEAQAIIMNFLRLNVEMAARTGPVSGIVSCSGFVQRVKPLYFIKEKEIVIYAFLNGILFGFDECPHAAQSYRARIRDILNDYEARYPGTKEQIVNSFLSVKPKLMAMFTNGVWAITTCRYCHEPSKGLVCNTCNIIMKQKKQNDALVSIR